MNVHLKSFIYFPKQNNTRQVHTSFFYQQKYTSQNGHAVTAEI